ncbi:hypothetical protein CR513_06784, partial [Mucuna pruriens]
MMFTYDKKQRLFLEATLVKEFSFREETISYFPFIKIMRST